MRANFFNKKLSYPTRGVKMSNNLALKSFSSALTLSICLLSQSALGMNLEKEDITQISSKKSKKTVSVPDTPWIHLKPHLENLIRQTVEDPLCEERTIHFKRLGKDSEDYFEWKEQLQNSFSYPISIGSGNEGTEGVKVDGQYEKYNSFLRISNYTKKEQDARELPYKKFGGNFNKNQINLETFYNLMVRAGFKEDEFAKGKYGYQDQIYVKPVYLKNKVLDVCAIEMKENILSTLQRVTQPYVAFILELAQNTPYTLEELSSYGGRESFFHEIEPLAEIVEQKENRIYVVYYNEKKSHLDLHELALNEAKEKVTSFIKEKYDNFETECTITTGRGNHVNSNGTSGVLKQMLPLWANSELKSYIQEITLCNGGGFYKVKLIEPVHITLTSKIFEEDVGKVSFFISKENEKGHHRLKIIHENHPSEYIDKVIMEVIGRSSEIASFPQSYNFGTLPTAHHLTWNQKESTEQNNLRIQSLTNGQGQKKAQPKQNNTQQKKKQQEIKCNLGNNKGTINNGHMVNCLGPKYNAAIPITAVNPGKLEEFVSKNNVICNRGNAEQKQKAIPVDDGGKEKILLNAQDLSPHPENAENKKTRKKNKNRTLTNPSYMEYIKQIDLGQPIYLPKSSTEENILIVEALIQKVIERRIENPVKVRVSLNTTEFMNFDSSFAALVSRYPSPFTWSTENKGYCNQGTDQPTHLLELNLASRAKKREMIEVKSIYQISQEDERKVNWPDIFDVAMRSNFTPEDLTFQKSIKVRLLDLQGNSEEKILEEFYQFLTQKLLKDSNPFHILGITFNSKIKANTGSMLGGFLRKVNEVQVGLRSRGTAFDPQNGSLYLCLNNTQRKLLDLHAKRLNPIGYDGKSVKEAGPETKSYIIKAYENFEEQITVLTGYGKHVNINGTQGVLKAAFEDWMQDPYLSPLIASYLPVGGDGGYKVSFVKIQTLKLHNIHHPNTLPNIRNTISQMAEHNKKRLRIILTEKDGSLDDREFKLLTSIYADLKNNNEQFTQSLLPISFESVPGELKIIFNKQHPKSSSFTFMNQHGSKSSFGTIL